MSISRWGRARVWDGSGRTGSGKSTTVSILTGLLEPSGGRVCVDGIDASDRLLEYKARLGYVPEEAHLYSYLSGPEYLTLIGRLRSMPEAGL
jgi:ABC-2 type transport system ATP-binding protein